MKEALVFTNDIGDGKLVIPISVVPQPPLSRKMCDFWPDNGEDYNGARDGYIAGMTNYLVQHGNPLLTLKEVRSWAIMFGDFYIDLASKYEGDGAVEDTITITIR